ncbi:MAG: hypothetical protein Q8P18_22990 [Pseudomonadota bacterium]|nr:hypothetical protein [Pseudomonadota bacterium]
MATEDKGEKQEYQFEKHVFPAELASIRARLDARALRVAREEKARTPGVAPSTDVKSPGRLLEEPTTPGPSTAHGLVGLALSGGGIRSAMFNLGILQGLHRSGLLRHVDYLSTVSGGGYIGAAWSALTHKAGAPFPFAHTKEVPEPPAVVYLRNNANYLMLGGTLDGARMAMVILRGILVNVLVVLPWLILAAVATSLLYWPQLVAENGERLGPEALHAFAVTKYLVPAYIGALLLTPLATRILAWKEARWPGTAENYRERDLFENGVAVGALAVAAVAFGELQPVLVSFFRDLSLGGHREAWTGGSGALSVAAALLARQSTGKELGAKITLAFAAILGPLIPLLIYVYLAEWLIYEGTDPGFLYEKGWALAAVALLVYTHVFVNVNQHSGHRFWRDRLSKSFLQSPLPDGALEHVDGLKLSRLGEEGSEAPYHLLNTTLNLQGDRDMVNRARSGDFFLFSKHFVGGERVGYIPTPVMEGVSPHINLGTAMAISSAAAAPNMGASTISAVTALMTLLNVRMGFWIPQPRHVAAALDLDADEPLRPRRRTWRKLRWNADPRYLWRELVGNLDAKSPLVNVSDGGHLENLGVYELLRRRCRYIICGDGEADPDMHFGALSALIRYARLDLGIDIDIALGDVALSPDRAHCRQHCALGTIRYPARDGRPAEHGVLLYMKSSLTDDEDSMLAQYRATSPTFPHESTADQFFSEAQLEAYRSLGYHIATTTFEDALGRPTEDLAHGEARILPYSDAERVGEDGAGANPGLTGAFRRLRIMLATHPKLSDTTFSELQGELGEVLRHAGPNELFEYYAELFPAIDDGLPSTSARRIETDGMYRRRILEVVGGQLALMESVYRRLDLHQMRMRKSDANAGWISLFRGWALAPSFRWAATLHSPSMTQGLRVFCHDVLGMVWSLDWRLAEDDAASWKAGRASDGGLRLIGSVAIAGVPVAPREDLAFVDLGDDRTTLSLGQHGLRPGFEGGDNYRLFLRELSALVASGSPLLPKGRTWSAPPESLHREHRDDVDARDILRGIRPPHTRLAPPTLVLPGETLVLPGETAEA